MTDFSDGRPPSSLMDLITSFYETAKHFPQRVPKEDSFRIETTTLMEKKQVSTTG